LAEPWFEEGYADAAADEAAGEDEEGVEEAGGDDLLGVRHDVGWDAWIFLFFVFGR